MIPIHRKIPENAFASYAALMQYTLIWRKLDLSLLEQVITPNVTFDAPGIPYDVRGAKNVLEAHKVFFDNLREADKRILPTKQDQKLSSCYSVITQIYPYEHKEVFPFMQLNYFTEHEFLKLVYFFVDLDDKKEKIQNIKTHSTKFLVDSSDFKSTLKQIQLLHSSLNIIKS